MMTQNSATGCQQWSLLSTALSSPLASAGPLVSALAVYLWWKLIRRLTAWIFRWQRRLDFSRHFRLVTLQSIILLHCLSCQRRKKPATHFYWPHHFLFLIYLSLSLVTVYLIHSCPAHYLLLPVSPTEVLFKKKVFSLLLFFSTWFIIFTPRISLTHHSY